MDDKTRDMLIDLTKSRKVIAGKRYFRCECGSRWVSHSRDMMSPSGEECNRCQEWVTPHSFRQEKAMKLRPLEKISPHPDESEQGRLG